jgi:hypothetical protein
VPGRKVSLAFVVFVGLAVACLAAQGADRNVDADLVKLIAQQEVAAGRLEVTSTTCLGLDRASSDPSRLLLRELKAKGLALRKASACLRLPGEGILFTVAPATKATDNDVLKVEIEISDLNIEEGTHFATILFRGIYTVTKDANRAWIVLGHQASDLQ